MFLFASLFAGFLFAVGLGLVTLLLMARIAKAGSIGEMMSLPGKILLTVGLFVVVGVSFAIGKDGRESAKVIALFAVLVAAIPLAAMWLPHIVSGLLSPILGSMTGGDEEVERRPFYPHAVAHRKRGEPTQALAAVEAQLALFPGDAEGLHLLASIHLEDLKDTATAVAILTEMVDTPGRAGGEVAVALNRIAELQLNRLNDIPSARETYQRIVDRFPDSEAALTAHQHLAHLPGADQLAQKTERPKLVVTHHETRIGLADDHGASQALPEDMAGEIDRLTAHLDLFPEDWDAREKLALLYIDHANRFDLATDQLEHLIRQPSAPTRHVVRWLNELADIQLRSSDGIGVAKLTLERIGQAFPGSQWADQALNRIARIGLDRRAKAESKTLKLGDYEQNIGLKRGNASIPDPAAHTR